MPKEPLAGLGWLWVLALKVTLTLFALLLLPTDSFPGTVESVGTRSGEAVIVFENDTYDVKATGTLTADCGPADVESATLEAAMTVHHTDGRHAYVFAGGCFALEFPTEVSDADEEALLAAVSFLSRDELRSLTGWTL